MIHTQDQDFTLLCGDVLDELATLPDESVHCVVTSPPYWGLRDYGTGSWDGGDPDCDHRKPFDATSHRTTGLNIHSDPEKAQANIGHKHEAFRDVCGKCGARRVDQQLGLEPTPELYVARMVEVFREVRRVLRADGTCWVNLGDSYANPSSGGGGPVDVRTDGRNTTPGDRVRGRNEGVNTMAAGLKQKDLCGIPWAVARALQEPYYTGRIPAERDRVWLAATIDGEGTICGTAHKRRDDGRIRTMPQVFITNSSQAMLDEAQRIWSTSQSGHSRPGDGHMGTVDVFRWIVHGIENKTALVRELYPYLIVKRTQALLAYNLLVLMADAKRLSKTPQAQAIRDKRELLCRLMSELNHAQSVDVPSWCVEPPSLNEPGWYLRSDIIWAKPNPMPESVTDRPTKAHEYVFLLSKSPRYFFDQEAVRERADEVTRRAATFRNGGPYTANRSFQNSADNEKDSHGDGDTATGRNVRSVWNIATQPYADAHFATYPEALVRRCILAGTSERGCCPECGKPWERETERPAPPGRDTRTPGEHTPTGDGKVSGSKMQEWLDANPRVTTGWRSGCDCRDSYSGIHPRTGKTISASEPPESIPCTVLDPFLGSGTTAYVARKHGRRSIGIELNPEYADLAARRMSQQSLLV